ncbi:hypothetical protein PanWU01x14_203140 [Parasponia andersonii]|uniref:Transmembrane protein n=1 Tax=Parasponia andersonii TaxID=3476 RepID=A0A2P5BWZ5_PARAD|nr:hypothetical protein PanWU01x14_203140 [Parasponia andersonii]
MAFLDMQKVPYLTSWMRRVEACFFSVSKVPFKLGKNKRQVQSWYSPCRSQQGMAVFSLLIPRVIRLYQFSIFAVEVDMVAFCFGSGFVIISFVVCLGIGVPLNLGVYKEYGEVSFETARQYVLPSASFDVLFPRYLLPYFIYFSKHQMLLWFS